MLTVILIQKSTLIQSRTSYNISENIIDTVSATCYYPDPSQTDNTPYITADNSIINKTSPINHRWIAVSRDLLGVYNMGCTVKISNTGVYDGLWVVKDKMHKRWRKKIDFLVNKDSYIDSWGDSIIIKRK